MTWVWLPQFVSRSENPCSRRSIDIFRQIELEKISSLIAPLQTGERIVVFIVSGKEARSGKMGISRRDGRGRRHPKPVSLEKQQGSRFAGEVHARFSQISN
jgi:hypothetical protein